VLTARCVVDKLKEDRLRAHMIEAAEQCERTALPVIDPLARIDALLGKWPADRTLYFCDERGGEPFSGAIRPGPGAVLIGPEGGFTDSENAAIRAHPCARPVSLGPRILRADTAAVAAISVWMSQNGDWTA
jgi:16S rRNA (uracil1498-N3)-methyltransferase